ncbi:alpha/beta hydrolase [Nocardioides sp.]|uniref:alpha/beta fold hydrolase n=1 Tax=Nocardioides sp. TaxID=35761 RepID=UPI002ED6049C
MRLVRVGDVELCVDEYGDPGDPPVLLLYGAAGSMDWWDVGFCEGIAAGGRRVIRYDHRDTGRSTTWPAGAPAYDGGALERDCIGLIEALGHGPAHLVGLSMGGGIAQSVADHRPDLVAALTLIATTAAGGVESDSLPGLSPELQALFADPPPDPDWTDRDAVIAYLSDTDRAYSGRLFDEDRTRKVAGEVFDRSIDPAAAGNHWLLVGGDDDEPTDVRWITAPTLVVHGTEDPMFPLPHGEALAAAIPGARLLVVEGMGHQVPPQSAWDQVVPAILSL